MDRVTLSTGTVVVETPQPDGYNYAEIEGRPEDNLTDEEWDEYCAIKVASKHESNPNTRE